MGAHDEIAFWFKHHSQHLEATRRAGNADAGRSVQRDPDQHRSSTLAAVVGIGPLDLPVGVR